jgi:hypothetical protein
MVYVCVCVYEREREREIFFIHSSVDGHIGLLHSLVIVNSAAINMGVKVFLLFVDLHSFECMPRSV